MPRENCVFPNKIEIQGAQRLRNRPRLRSNCAVAHSEDKGLERRRFACMPEVP
jgi:hypothetical protein